MVIEPYKKYKCVVKQRQEYNGRMLKDNHAKIEGQTYMFEAMWLMDNDDPYPGEWAMGVCGKDVESFYAMGYGWIASGDLEIIEKVVGE